MHKALGIGLLKGLFGQKSFLILKWGICKNISPKEVYAGGVISRDATFSAAYSWMLHYILQPQLFSLQMCAEFPVNSFLTFSPHFQEMVRGKIVTVDSELFEFFKVYTSYFEGEK